MYNPVPRPVKCLDCQGSGRVRRSRTATGWSRTEPTTKADSAGSICTYCHGRGSFIGVRVIEVDQWTSTMKEWRTVRWVDWINPRTRPTAATGDAGTIRTLGITHVRIRSVPLDAAPAIGNVWFVRGRNGFPRLWRTRYDSSG